MLQVSIWKKSTAQPDQKTLIGDITLSECNQPPVDRLVVNVNQPTGFGSRPVLMRGSVAPEQLLELVANLAAHLDPTLNGRLNSATQTYSRERWGLLLSVSVTGPHPREVAKLVVASIESKPAQFLARWLAFDLDWGVHRAQVEFLRPPDCPWRVLRAAATVMAQVSALYGVVGARFGDLIDDAVMAQASDDGR